MTPAKFTRTTISERESVGEKLAKKRNSLHLDIKDIERALKIPAKHVRYIEDGNYEKLPPDVYTRGFVKNYAAFLGLNQRKILDAYSKERGLNRKIKEVKNPSQKKKELKSPKFVITSKKLVLFFSSVAVLAVVVFIGWQIKILTAPPSLELRSPQNDTTVSDDYIFVEGQTNREADVYINDAKVNVNDDGVFKERVSLQDGVNIVKIKARYEKMNRETTTERKIVAKLPASPAIVDRTLYPVELKIIIGPSSSTVEIVRDGEKLNVSGVMLAGSTQVFYAKDNIVLSTNNAGSTKIVLNGKDLGPMGKEGQVIKNKKFVK